MLRETTIANNATLCVSSTAALAIACKITCLGTVLGAPKCIAECYAAEAVALATCLGHASNSRSSNGLAYEVGVKRCHEDCCPKSEDAHGQ